jgi:hypothetical protein
LIQPGQPVLLDQLHATIIITGGDSCERKYCISVAGSQLEAFSNLLKNIDLIYDLFWVFKIKYTPAVNLLHPFLQTALCKQRSGHSASSAAELSAMLCAFKRPDEN